MGVLPWLAFYPVCVLESSESITVARNSITIREDKSGHENPARDRSVNPSTGRLQRRAWPEGGGIKSNIGSPRKEKAASRKRKRQK